MGLKRQKFSCSLLTRHLYTRQLACEPQTGSLAYLSVAVRNGTEKNDQFSRSKFLHPPVEEADPTSRSMQAAAFACLYTNCIQGQTMLKVHGNLNKGASGSMKWN